MVAESGHGNTCLLTLLDQLDWWKTLSPRAGGKLANGEAGWRDLQSREFGVELFRTYVTMSQLSLRTAGWKGWPVETLAGPAQPSSPTLPNGEVWWG